MADVVSGVAARVQGAVEAATDIVGDAAKALATPTGLAGAAVEALWLGTHLAIYPLGLVGARARDVSHGYRIEHLAPVQRGLVISDIEAAGTPILLLHGMADNRSVFTLLRLGLRRRGFGQVTTLNYSILTGDIRVAAAQLAEEVEALVAETGYERVHVVGHSMGGLIARYYVTRLGGDERVHTLVTLGSPHHGTYTAYAWNSRIMQQLRPGEPADAGAGAAHRELPHPLPLLLVGPRPADVPPADRRPRAPGPQRHQRRDARSRSHEPADHASRWCTGSAPRWPIWTPTAAP